MKPGGSKAIVLLFDLDGTLIDVFYHHHKCLDKVVNEVWQIKGRPEGLEVSGIPQLKTLKNVAQHHGVSEEGIRQHIDEAQSMLTMEMSQSLPSNLSGALLPGTELLLKKLTNTEGVFLGLVTGTLGPTAQILLVRSGLKRYFPVGAFGHEAEGREGLVQLAVDRVCVHYNLRRENLALSTIGDAPSDIMAGRAHGARTVAVATGGFTAEELAVYQPDVLFDDMREPERVYSTLVVGVE